MPLPKTPPKMFETRSQSWQEAGLLEQLSPAAARRARVEAIVLAVLFVAIVVLWNNRASLLDETLEETQTPLNLVVVLVLLVLGWAIAREVGRSLGPALFRRMEPATAGTVGFLIRLPQWAWRCWWRCGWPA